MMKYYTDFGINCKLHVIIVWNLMEDRNLFIYASLVFSSIWLMFICQFICVK